MTVVPKHCEHWKMHVSLWDARAQAIYLISQDLAHSSTVKKCEVSQQQTPLMSLLEDMHCHILTVMSRSICRRESWYSRFPKIVMADLLLSYELPMWKLSMGVVLCWWSSSMWFRRDLKVRRGISEKVSFAAHWPWMAEDKKVMIVEFEKNRLFLLYL